MYTNNHSLLISPEDLNNSVIQQTVQTINANAGKFVLLTDNGSMHLYEVIAKLSQAGEDQESLTTTRFAYEITFHLPTMFYSDDCNTQWQNVQSFSELLEQFEYNDNFGLKYKNYYHVVVDDSQDTNNDDNSESSKAVATLFQQTVFLNLDIDIKKKSEIEKSRIKDKFRKNYKQLSTEINTQKQYLEACLDYALLMDSNKERIQRILSSFDNILVNFEKAKERPIRIAAMGTKKAGKSVIINSILKQDYAPTSSELPTPNVIKYVPINGEDQLILEYPAENERYFEDAESLRKFIGEEFEKAQKNTGEGSGLDNMVVYYPSEELSGYEIWDTPGPNFAGAGEEHHKIAEQCIESADICIFVMNYSSHLTDDEINFLAKIHKVFKENNKFYSLFITINRIDERYAANVEKSVNRIIDYIRYRLEDLGYKNIVLFATSALQSFYLDKVIDLMRKEDESDENLPQSIKFLKKKYKNFRTEIRFIEDAFKNLEDFHDIEEPCIDDIRSFSGMPQLEKYVKYIGEQKIDTEIVDSVVSRCEFEFVSVKNNLDIITELYQLRDEDEQQLEKLSILIDELTQGVATILQNIEPLINKEKNEIACYRLKNGLSSIKEVALQNAKARTKYILDNSNISKDDIELVKNGISSQNIISLHVELNKMVESINKASTKNLDLLIGDIRSQLARSVERGIQNAQEKIQSEQEKVKQQVENSKASQDILEAFQTPHFPISLDQWTATARSDIKIDSQQLRSDASNSIRRERTVEYINKTRQVIKKREARGFWENVKSFFGAEYYEEITEYYKDPVEKYVYNVDIDAFKEKISIKLQDHVAEQLNKSHRKMETILLDSMNDFVQNITIQCQNIKDSYNNLFHILQNDIKMAQNQTNEHRSTLEHDIQILNDIKQHLQFFFDLWHDILYK